jgi:hypothetical protein
MKGDHLMRYRNIKSTHKNIPIFKIKKNRFRQGGGGLSYAKTLVFLKIILMFGKKNNEKINIEKIIARNDNCSRLPLQRPGRLIISYTRTNMN